MITSINEKNVTEYKELFTEARKLLIENGKNVEEINDIEGYFQHLKDLININGGKKFSMLPLDEDFFIIDANKREIQIPDNFKKNGLSVQGDETAEIVWFEIDRYYDIMDFNNTTPVIQWKRKNEDEIHKSAIWYSTIEKKPGKLIFGWPIDYSITEVSGDIEFSVRFLTYDNTNNILTYSFNTLPATININKSLDIKNIDTSADSQILSKIEDRIFNSIPGDLSQPLPPIFIQPNKSGYLNQNLSNSFLDIGSSEDIIINLDKVSQGFSKTINAAVFSTANGVTYNWRRDSLDSGANQSDYFSEENPENTEVYFKIGSDNKISNIDKKLSIYKDSQCTELININEEIIGDSFNIIEPSSPVDSKLLSCWIKGGKDGDFSSCTIKKPGKYYVEASNPNPNGYAGSLVSTMSKMIEVPYPTKPKLLEYLKVVNENTTSQIQNGKIIIPLSSTEIKIKPNYTIPDNENDCLSFEWKNDNSLISTNEILTLTNESELGEYKVAIKNSFNGGLTQNEEELSLVVTRTLSIIGNKSFISYDKDNNKLIQTITLDIGTSKTLPLKYYLEGIEFQLYQTGIALSPNLTKDSSMTNLTEKEFEDTVDGLNSMKISINRSSKENQASRCVITCSYDLPNLNDSYPSVAGIVRIKRDWNSTEIQEFVSDTYSKSELIPNT